MSQPPPATMGPLLAPTHFSQPLPQPSSASQVLPMSLDNMERCPLCPQPKYCKGTDARQLVESYPITPENYPKCIEHLKSRYAREDLQTQLYVRELLSLIMQREKHTNITTLYDKISAQLRSLETLGVTKKNAAFILPMVESALPEEYLKAWQRTGKHDNDMETELSNLLSFLHTEVEHNQRIEMARMNFNKEEPKESLPTASCLFTAKNTQQKTELCIWCDKNNHTSLECYKLQKLTLEQRREVIQKKKACSICLKRGHFFKNCRSFIKCLICKKKHSTVLCMSQKQEQKLNEEKKTEFSTTTATTSSMLKSTTTAASSEKQNSTTLLQAVRVSIEHNGVKIPVRAVFDNGSQRTYIQEKIIKKLQLPACGQERLGHSLFGGKEIESKNYNVYNVKVNSLDGSYSTEIEALGQDTLCHNIPKYHMTLSKFAEVFKTNLIHLTDNDNPSDEVGLLIGADISGKFLTGQMLALDEEEYWSLESLGIKDPVEIKTKEAAEDEILKTFEETIKINEEKRYEERRIGQTWHPEAARPERCVIADGGKDQRGFV
ncbi:hypothetical protein NE865_01688 [Phthorimaea operculella]|nr:hypothetical protein NE865_01688 [Phthorimaea operculella]